MSRLQPLRQNQPSHSRPAQTSLLKGLSPPCTSRRENNRSGGDPLKDSPPDLFYPVPLSRPSLCPSFPSPAIRVPLALRGRTLWDFGAFPVPLFPSLYLVTLPRPSFPSPAIRVPLALHGRSLWDFGAFPVPLFPSLFLVPAIRVPTGGKARWDCLWGSLLHGVALCGTRSRAAKRGVPLCRSVRGPLPRFSSCDCSSGPRF